MSIKKRLIPALVGSALALGATASNAVQFSGVFVFGDSLSDAGYFRPFLGALGVPASLVPVLGRFTTNPGPVWAELIATNYGGNPNPSNAGGQNYAQGGARVAVSSPSTPPGGNPNRSVATQITEYLGASGSADSRALYAVWAGANDIFQTLPAINAGTVNPSTFLAQTAAAEVQQIARLQAAGAKYILVFGLPDIGATPAFRNPAFGGSPALAGAGTSLSAGFNINLFNTIAASGLRVIPVDTFTLFTEVNANPAAFGFTNTTSSACSPVGLASLGCFSGNSVPGGASTYIYADAVHPTSAAHAITADFVKALIDGPNAYSTMAEVPLASRAAHIRTLDEGVMAGQRAAIGKVTAFAAGDGGKFNISTTSLNPQTDSKNRTATIGLTFRASESFTVGVAVGKSTADATMNGFGKFSTSETAGSVFGSLKSGDTGFYGNFSATIANIQFNDVQRNIKLGITTRTNTASTKGDNASANVTLGYDFALGGLTVGPFVGMTNQNVTVNEFVENNGNPLEQSTRLKISAQDRNSNVTSVGARASFKLGSWTPFARISYDQENKRDPRMVTASPVTITQGISYDIPGYAPSKSWSTGTIGIRGNITDQIGLAVVYSSVFGRDNVKQDGVTANVSFAF